MSHRLEPGVHPASGGERFAGAGGDGMLVRLATAGSGSITVVEDTTSDPEPLPVHLTKPPARFLMITVSAVGRVPPRRGEVYAQGPTLERLARLPSGKAPSRAGRLTAPRRSGVARAPWP